MFVFTYTHRVETFVEQTIFLFRLVFFRTDRKNVIKKIFFNAVSFEIIDSSNEIQFNVSTHVKEK